MNDTFTNHKEPDEIFLPLSAGRYAEFYAMEMDGFTEDIHFYKTHCGKASSILELGCGTGRISRALAKAGCRVTGIDISLEMLKQAGNHSLNPQSFICMDMTAMAFRADFDHILIPYNTLNLLKNIPLITRCLQQVYRYLRPGGSLLLQLHIPDGEIIEMNGKRRFQFQVFPLPQRPGKLIKETLRSYDNTTREIRMEERYRVRPTGSNTSREDFNHVLHLAGFPVRQWLNILTQSGFPNYTLFGDYNSGPFNRDTDSTLLIKAFPS